MASPARSAREQTKLGKAGDLPLELETERDAGVPYVYTLEGDVEDVSRQHIANRASVTVHPGAVVRRRPAAGLLSRAEGRPEDGDRRGRPRRHGRGGVPVDVKLTQIQWKSVRRAEGNGFYTWDTERKEVPCGQLGRHDRQLIPCRSTFRFANGGYFMLEAHRRVPATAASR